MSSAADLRQSKAERLRRGGVPRLMDLFSGCGGLTLGFRTSGFQCAGFVEIDRHAADTFALNFHPGLHSTRSGHSPSKDITEVDAAGLLASMGLPGDAGSHVDVLVGGPPCQAFARVGRAKLREVHSNPEAFRVDPRSDLYLRYLAYVEALKPLAILVENVPDSINHGGHNIPEEMCECLSDLGYSCQYTLLNSVNYGVPQLRLRMFLVAIFEDVGTSVPFRFPEPTHHWPIPPGYAFAEKVSLNRIRPAGESLFPELVRGGPSYLTMPPPAKISLAPAVSVEEALGDLPHFDPSLSLDGSATLVSTMLAQSSAYAAAPGTGYQRLMRTWPGFEGQEEAVANHVVRHLPRDFHLFKAMDPTWGYPEVKSHAEGWFASEISRKRTRGEPLPAEGTPEWKAFKDSMVPPYDPSKFKNRWQKLHPDQPSHTLLAHLGKDSYSHIHYDSAQGRTISVREAARLQSFPDGFQFACGMNASFRQIGNAVPPLLARALAVQIKEALGCRMDSPLFQG